MTLPALPTVNWKQETAFYSITANPLGFHHLAAAEWLLQQKKLQRVVLLISNGFHPDPYKTDVTTGARERIEWAKQLLTEASDKDKSALSQTANDYGQSLQLNSAIEISERELQFDRPVRMVEHLRWLQSLGLQTPIPWLVGTDLLHRLSDIAIFSDADVKLLAKHLEWHVLERSSHSLQQTLSSAQERAASLDCYLQVFSYPLKQAPLWLRPFLSISSHAIRHCAESGDPLTGMVSSGLVQKLTKAYAPSTTDALHHQAMTPLQHELAQAWFRLLQQGRRVHQLLLDQQPTPILVINETSSGGLISHSLLAFPNASRYFHQTHIPYSKEAQQNLGFTNLSENQTDIDLSQVSQAKVNHVVQHMRASLTSSRPLLALAESGMAGPPDGQHRSQKNGQCWIALASSNQISTHCITLPPFLTRLEHQIGFATQTLQWLEQELPKHLC